MFFSRHGECDSWRDKRFGLNPNAAVSDNAMENMERTKTCTRGMLLSPYGTPRIGISPMLRAKQTASMVIPEGTRADLTVEATLSENSNAPSGTSITSMEDFQNLTRQLSFWSSPVKYILFKLSQFIYGVTGTFDSIGQKLQSTDNVLEGYQDNGDSLDSSHIEPVADADKVTATKALVSESLETHDDTWLFGHGKNFKVFLKRPLERAKVLNTVKPDGFISLKEMAKQRFTRHPITSSLTKQPVSCVQISPRLHSSL